MSARIVVIGGGASGAAAAFAARQAGANVTVVMGRPGATSLGSGALDGPPLASLGPAGSAVRAFADAIALWDVAPDGCQLATRSGLIRAARGRDASLLDVGALKNGVVAVVDPSRPGWDAAWLARAWSAEPWARAHGLRFEAVAVDVLRHAHEAAAPDADLALLHDEPGRVAWLIERLKHAPALAGKCAALVGPWLGAKPGLAARIGGQIGKPVGEPLSSPGGAAGLRFETARDALFARLDVARVAGVAKSLTAGAETPSAVQVVLESGETIDAEAAVLAVGGVVGGGIRFAPHAPFILSLASPAVLAAHGTPLVTSGSPHGAPFESFAWSGGSAPSGLEKVGIWVDAEGRLQRTDGPHRAPLFAAGDAVADSPRTILAALCSGVVAGRRAAEGARAIETTSERARSSA
jgi:glycerol-3-phosphate dehydrogenase subunit B